MTHENIKLYTPTEKVDMIRKGHVDFTDDLLEAQAERVEESKRNLEQRVSEHHRRARLSGDVKSSEYPFRPAHSDYKKELTSHRIIKRAVDARKEGVPNHHVTQSLSNLEDFRDQIERAAGIRPKHFLSIDDVVKTPPRQPLPAGLKKKLGNITSISLESGLDRESPLPPPRPLRPKKPPPPPPVSDAVTATSEALKGIDLNQSLDLFASLTDSDLALAQALGSTSLIDLDQTFHSSQSLFDLDTPRLLESVKQPEGVTTKLVSPLPATPQTTTTSAIESAIKAQPVPNDSLSGLEEQEVYDHKSAEEALRSPFLSRAITTIPLPPTRARPSITTTSPSSSRTRPIVSSKIGEFINTISKPKQGPASSRLSNLITDARAGSNVKTSGASNVVVDQDNLDRRLEETQFDQFGDHKVEQYESHGLTESFRDQERKRQIKHTSGILKEAAESLKKKSECDGWMEVYTSIHPSLG